MTSYLKQLVEVDIPGMGNRRNPGNLERLLAALARGVGQAVKLSELAKDVGGEAGPVANETLYGYLEALDRLNLTDNLEAWRPHMRSRSRLRAAPVRYFVDPSIGTAALHVGTKDLMADPRALGFHFEALVIRDLRIYAQPLDGTIDSWRDGNGHEVHAVVTLPGARSAAFEINSTRAMWTVPRPRSCALHPALTPANTASPRHWASSPAPATQAAAKTAFM